jgi:hypothetical protein
MTISRGAISDYERQVAGDEDDRAVFADAAGEGERKTGQDRRCQPRQQHAADGLEAIGAERGCCFLHFLVDLFHHRLHGAHDEGQADEDQRDYDADGREGDLDAERRQEGPIQPFGA